MHVLEGRCRAGLQHSSSRAGARHGSCSQQQGQSARVCLPVPRRVRHPRRQPAVSSKHQNADVVSSGAAQRQSGQGNSSKPELDEDQHLHRLLKESKRNLQLSYTTSEDDDEDGDESPPISPGMAHPLAVAAAAAAAMASQQQQQQLPPPGTPPLVYPGRGVPLNPAAAAAAQGGGVNPFGPLPPGAAAAAGGNAAAAAAGGTVMSPGGQPQQQQQQQGAATPLAAASAAEATGLYDGGQQQQYYAAGAVQPGGTMLYSSSTSSMDGSTSVGGQWPAGEASSSAGGRSGCPVYVMLPLDTVWVVERDNQKVAILKREKALEIALHTLRQAGVEGVMVDVWWGIVERAGPNVYDFSAYRRLFNKCAAAGLKVQAVMSFHAAGGNVGDTCKIPLPKWVVDIGERNPDIFYTDKQMHRNKECLSLGCDEVPLFWGRSPVDMYRDFMEAFANSFQHMFGSVIAEITVGLGPAGELRYPSYPEGDARWRFPGVGEYQCCDRYMLADLRAAAAAAGHPEWGHGGPHDAGHYNSHSWETGFFKSQGGRWQSEYGHFFQSWYSGLLVRHARRVLGVAAEVLNQPGRPRVMRACKEMQGGHVMYEFVPAVQLGAKLAGVHWWFKSSAHAAELTAGYYNTRFRDGYAPIIQVLAEFKGRLSFTCVEMRDCEHPPEGRCSPQGLLQQVLETAEHYGVPLAGENALQRYDEHAFDRIAESAFGRTARAGRLEQLTFLRMGDLMFDNWDAFCSFLKRMRGDHPASSSSSSNGSSSGGGGDYQQQQQEQYYAQQPLQAQQQQQQAYAGGYYSGYYPMQYPIPVPQQQQQQGGNWQQQYAQPYLQSTQPYTQQSPQQQQQQAAYIYQQQQQQQQSCQRQQALGQAAVQQQQQHQQPAACLQQQQEQEDRGPLDDGSSSSNGGSGSSTSQPPSQQQQQQPTGDPSAAG